METLQISKIQHASFAEGPRCNTTVWLAGCSIRCPGCFNPELWNPRAGQAVSITEVLRRISVGLENGDNGLALVGGEPFNQAEGLASLLKAFKERFPTTLVTLYSGFRIDVLLERQDCIVCLDLADVLVDGPFLLEQVNADPGYRGSFNQRVINLVRSRSSRYQDLHLLKWDKLIAFLPNGSLTGPGPVLSIFSGEDSLECGYHGG